MDTLLYKYTLLTTGLVFLFVWLIVLAISSLANDEPPVFSVYFVIGLPLAQATTFTIYRTNRQKQILGGAFLAVMAISVVLYFLANAGSFLTFFLVVSFASALLHTFYGFYAANERKTMPPV